MRRFISPTLFLTLCITPSLAFAVDLDSEPVCDLGYDSKLQTCEPEDLTHMGKQLASSIGDDGKPLAPENGKKGGGPFDELLDACQETGFYWWIGNVLHWVPTPTRDQCSDYYGIDWSYYECDEDFMWCVDAAGSSSLAILQCANQYTRCLINSRP
jgi:hypothetical protein